MKDRTVDELGLTWPSVTNIYQSNGACHDTCSAEYAFAVVQYQSCWCTNIAPGTTTSVGNCNEDCPGYPAEKCGNSDSGLFGYIALNNSPSGTAGGSSSSTPPPTSTRQVSPSCSLHIIHHSHPHSAVWRGSSQSSPVSCEARLHPLGIRCRPISVHIPSPPAIMLTDGNHSQHQQQHHHHQHKNQRRVM